MDEFEPVGSLKVRREWLKSDNGFDILAGNLPKELVSEIGVESSQN